MKQTLKLLVLCVVFIVASSSSALAQEEEATIRVTSFKELPEDMSARIIAPKKDFNGKLSAIVKLVTSEKGFVVDNGVLGVVGTKEEVGELWIYLPEGTKRITLKHPTLGVLRNYFFPQSLQEATVYEVRIKTPTPAYTAPVAVEQNNTSTQYVVLNYTPADLDVELYIDGTNYIPGSGGSISTKLSSGQHSYKLVAPKYITKTGVIEILDEKVTLDLALEAVSLKEPVRAFGSLDISSGNISGASIYIDGVKNSATTPDVISNLPAGDHIITLVKDGYKSVDFTVTIAANETTAQDIVLQRANATASSQSVYSTGSSAQSSEVIPSRSRSKGPRTGFLFGFEFSPLKYDYDGDSYQVTQYGGKIGYVFSESGIYAKALFGPTSSTEDVSAGRYSFLAGYSIAPARFLTFNVGVGAGQIILDYYGTKVVNRLSYELEAGFSIHLGVLYLSYSIGTFEFKNAESRFGVGFLF